jgi:hypothetical protein
VTAGDARQLDLGDVVVPVTTFEAFIADNPRRGTSFISNFGTWHLPSAAAASMRSPVTHLEWSHDTGELFLIGAVPVLGTGAVDVPPAFAAAASLGEVGGGETVLATKHEVSPGLVREFFPAETVPAGTAVAVLAVIEQGWTAHKVLWGWHEHQHSDDGWDWLLQHLRAHRISTARR